MNFKKAQKIKNCAFPKIFQTKKMGEVTVFFAVMTPIGLPFFTELVFINALNYKRAYKR